MKEEKSSKKNKNTEFNNLLRFQAVKPCKFVATNAVGMFSLVAIRFRFLFLCVVYLFLSTSFTEHVIVSFSLRLRFFDLTILSLSLAHSVSLSLYQHYEHLVTFRSIAMCVCFLNMDCILSTTNKQYCTILYVEEHIYKYTRTQTLTAYSG